MSYSVGQVVYLLSKKARKVFPCQVVEEICRKTIESEEISYMVKLPNTSASVINLNDIEASIFVSPDELKAYMVDNAIRSIEEIVGDAVTSARQIFNEVEAASEDHMSEDIMPSFNLSDLPEEIDIGNGVKARVNLKSIQDNLESLNA